MTPNDPMTHETRLTEICDELLASTGHLRMACEKAGMPWPNPDAKRLINRLLDVRNDIQKPQTQTKTEPKKTTKP